MNVYLTETKGLMRWAGDLIDKNQIDKAERITRVVQRIMGRKGHFDLGKGPDHTVYHMIDIENGKIFELNRPTLT